VSQDGKWLVFRESAPTLDLSLLSLEQPKEPARALLNTPASEQGGERSQAAAIGVDPACRHRR
jgi:hypothetical protein